MKFFATGTETGFFGASKLERLFPNWGPATTNPSLAKSFRGGFRLQKPVCFDRERVSLGIRDDRTYGE
ncbi:hypothetical protein D0A34_11720 [Microcoleus vaginatus PCC 9802]|uniref:hypothetical protein n=1 Tax=Microcoleus vaginatus TaxID=119532 RepID=UPI0002E9AA92|nr:hypothetical protein D0A34_11720 [Microcoleus vaginatus PCC 9802]